MDRGKRIIVSQDYLQYLEDCEKDLRDNTCEIFKGFEERVKELGKDVIKYMIAIDEIQDEHDEFLRNLSRMNMLKFNKWKRSYKSQVK
jgi:hypothetical protein